MACSCILVMVLNSQFPHLVVRLRQELTTHQEICLEPNKKVMQVGRRLIQETVLPILYNLLID